MHKQIQRNLKTHTQEGFSLIEIIIVMVIIGVLAGTAIPVYIGMGPSIRLSGATRQIMGDLMWARMRAISENNDYVIVFGSAGPDLSNNTYYIYDDDEGNFNTVGPETGELVKTAVIPDGYKGVGYGFVPGMKNTSGGTLNAGDPPVTFSSSIPAGNVRWVQFEPTGGANKMGSIYLILDVDKTSGRKERSRAITVIQNGRVRIYKYNAGNDKWE
ncbi:MAG: GspH/FimT family protein [Candidatus Brocadiaceae bacterium]|nr:GspH/FimT family protein [Candidatus Brocadiaceae bacterium]